MFHSSHFLSMAHKVKVLSFFGRKSIKQKKKKTQKTRKKRETKECSMTFMFKTFKSIEHPIMTPLNEGN